MTSFPIKSLAGSLICFANILFAKNPSMPPPSNNCPKGKQHHRISIRHIEGGGIGYNQGYTTLEAFLAPDPGRCYLLPFLDVRGHLFDKGKWAANAGAGLRTILGTRVYGINAYYDYRNTERLNYNQVSAGLETLGQIVDLRINGYLPFGKKISSPFHTKFVGFSGHNLIVSRKFQYALKGADAEIGFHFGKSRLFDFYAAAGPYYYRGELGRNIWGGKARLAGMFKDYITLEVSDSYDNTFHNRFQGQVSITVPFGPKSHVKKRGSITSCKLADDITSRMVQPVGRQEIIPVKSKRKKTRATDPVTGEPLFFVFVNNTSSSLGTFESPYPTLLLAQENSKPGDFIYVFSGDGTTKGMNAGMTLQKNQKFWGSGISHVVQTRQGTVTIPAQTTATPQMTNTAGNGITLAAGNDISGFVLTDVMGYGIFGIDPKNIQISSSTINNSQLDQIHLEYSTSSGTIALNNLTLTNGEQQGVFISSTTTSPIICIMNNCIIQDTFAGSIDASFANAATFTLTNSTIQRNGSASTFLFEGPSTLSVSGNTFSNNTSINLAPLFITADASPLSAAIAHNTINENVCGAVHFVLNDTNSAHLTLANNAIANNGIGAIGPFGASIFIDPNGTTSGNCNISLTDNILSGNTGASLYCANGNFNDFQVAATGNLLTGNGGGGCIFANGCNTFTLTATNNTISDAGDHGIATDGSVTMTTANMTFSNNQISGNTNFGNGIAISHKGTNLNFTATNNTISNNATSGILFFSSGVIENIAVKIENNTINNNQNLGSNAAGGVDIEQFDNLSGTFINNTLSNNTTSGVFIGSAEPSPSVCLEMVGNNSNTYVFSSGTGVFNLTPCNVATVNTGLIIPIGTITLVESCPAATPCPP